MYLEDTKYLEHNDTIVKTLHITENGSFQRLSSLPIIISPKWIMEIFYGAKNGVHAFGYNFAKGEPFGRNLEHIAEGWPWQILGVVRAVVTVSKADDK